MKNDNSGADTPLDQRDAAAKKAASWLKEAIALGQAALDMVCVGTMEALWKIRCTHPDRAAFNRSIEAEQARGREMARGLEQDAAEMESGVSEYAILLSYIWLAPWDLAGAWGAAQKHPALRAMISAAPRFVVRYPQAVLQQAALLDEGVVSADAIERRFQALEGMPAGPDRELLLDQLLNETVADAVENAAAGAVAAMRAGGLRRDRPGQLVLLGRMVRSTTWLRTAGRKRKEVSP